MKTAANILSKITKRKKFAINPKVFIKKTVIIYSMTIENIPPSVQPDPTNGVRQNKETSFLNKVGGFFKKLFSPVTNLFQHLFGKKSMSDKTKISERDITISAPTNFKHVDGVPVAKTAEVVPGPTVQQVQIEQLPQPQVAKVIGARSQFPDALKSQPTKVDELFQDIEQFTKEADQNIGLSSTNAPNEPDGRSLDEKIQELEQKLQELEQLAQQSPEDKNSKRSL